MKRRYWLVLGDCVTLGLITIIGFAWHGETGLSFALRMLSTFLPLLAGWFLVAPWLGLFNDLVNSDPRQFWRPVLAMGLAAPLTAILRAVMLNGVALPLFTLILGGSTAVGMLVWRVLWRLLWSSRPGT